MREDRARRSSRTAAVCPIVAPIVATLNHVTQITDTQHWCILAENRDNEAANATKWGHMIMSRGDHAVASHPPASQSPAVDAAPQPGAAPLLTGAAALIGRGLLQRKLQRRALNRVGEQEPALEEGPAASAGGLADGAASEDVEGADTAEEAERAPMPGGAPVQRAVVQRAVPVAIAWGAKAIAATSVDAFIDFAIAAILGLPAPGALDHVGNFLINLVPILSEAKKVKKVAKLLKLIGKIVEPIQKMRAAKIPGAGKLADSLIHEAGKVKKALRELHLDDAKAAFGRLLGYVREAQVATKLKDAGHSIEHLGKTIKAGGRQLTDIDVISREGGELVLNQVKAGNAARLTPGSDSWLKFKNQAERTQQAAKELGTAEGITPKVRYYVDDITAEARSLLEGLGFEVRMNSSVLH